jgi:uncharacterized protein YggT (Ycf19 family)
MIRPVLVFLLVLLVIAPVVAIAGVVAWGNWAPAGLMVSGALIFWAGRRALVPIRQYAPTLGGIQLRMKSVVWLVAGAGAVLSAGAAFWLGWRLVS